MVSIKFKKEFYKSIKNGSKTQTLRKASKRIDVKPGDCAVCIFEDCPATISIKITDVGYKMWKSLTDDDAELEGFDSLHELKMCLLKIYPDIQPWDRFYFYRFELEEVKVDKQYEDALKKLQNYTPKCPECGAELPRYPHYMSSHGDAIEVWICDKCGKYLERG